MALFSGCQRKDYDHSRPARRNVRCSLQLIWTRFANRLLKRRRIKKAETCQLAKTRKSLRITSSSWPIAEHAATKHSACDGMTLTLKTASYSSADRSPNAESKISRTAK